MHSPLRQLVHVGIIMLWIGAAAGCKPEAENVKLKEHVAGPPDLVKNAPADPANRSFQLSAFHLNHIWSSPHGATTPGFRAKVTIWDYTDDKNAVAELYFEDVSNGTAAGISDPNHTNRPYQIHFPVSTMGPIMSALRNSNEPVFLYYYQGAWAIGTYSAEPVGVD